MEKAFPMYLPNGYIKFFPSSAIGHGYRRAHQYQSISTTGEVEEEAARCLSNPAHAIWVRYRRAGGGSVANEQKQAIIESIVRLAVETN